MQLRDVMTRDVETIRPDATIQEAASKMDALNVGPLPVCDGNKLVGMITDRDITVRSTSTGSDPGSTRVRDAMSAGMVYAMEDDDVREGARLMEVNQIRRLPILDHDRRLVGIVSLGDVAVQTQDDSMSGEVLERVSEPAQPDRTGR